MPGYDSRVPEDAVWCIAKHIGGKYHAYEVYEKLVELGDEGPVLSRDLPVLEAKQGMLWRDVFLKLIKVLDAVDLSLEQLVSSKESLEQFLNLARDLRRVLLVFRLDYHNWKLSREQQNQPTFESAILQEAMYVRDHLLNIEEHIIEVLHRYA